MVQAVGSHWLKGVTAIVRKEMLPQLKGTIFSDYTHCVMENKHMVSFQESSTKKLDLLEQVYSYVH